MNIDPNYPLFKQDYKKKSIIDGVEIFDLRTFADESGTFCEQTRIQENGDFTFFTKQGDLKTLLGFKIKQINTSILRPGPIKAWHLHKKQTDVWTVPMGCGNILAGLYDLRDDSSTKGVSMRIYLGEYHTALLRIPPGVAHGYRVIGNKPAMLQYFIDKHFDPDDEFRLAYDVLDFNWNLENG